MRLATTMLTLLSGSVVAAPTLPALLTALGLNVWYAGDGATQPSTLVSAGDAQPVDQWGVAGTSAFDLTASGTVRPTYHKSLSAFNNRGGVTFASASVQLLSKTIAGSTIANASTYNVFVVFSTTAVGVNTLYAEGNNSSNNPMLVIALNAGNMQVQVRDGTVTITTILTVGMTYNDGKVHLVAFRRSGDNFEVRVDGQSVGTATRSLGTVTITNATMGALVRTATANYLTGTIALVAHGTSDVYLTAEPLIEAHYGITLLGFRIDFSTLAYGATVNINSVHIRNSAIASRGGQQAMSWWRPTELTIAARASGGSWRQYTYSRLSPTADLHDAVTVGIDPNLYLHACYNMHGVPLRYRKSNIPLSAWTGQLSDPLTMVSLTQEAVVTYPTFFNDPTGKLYFLFRDGSSGNGNLYFYAYNETAKTWGPAVGTSTGGLLINGVASTDSPYWEVPVFDANFGSGGFMHLSWCWRDTTSALTNFDYASMKWDGSNWFTEAGAAQTIPATTANDDVFDPVVSGNGLSNSNGLDADSGGHPHVAYFKNDGASHAQLFHAWHNGAAWIILKLTNTPTIPFGSGSTFLDMGRPSVLIDRATDTVRILYRDDSDVDGVLMMTSNPGDYTTWVQSVHYAVDVGYYEPNYDRQEWLINKKIVMQIAPWFNTNAASFDIALSEVAV